MDRPSFLSALAVTIDSEIVGGTPVFRGTRMPVQSLFDYVADGCTLDEFLDNFPTVQRADALQVLASIGQLVAACVQC